MVSGLPPTKGQCINILGGKKKGQPKMVPKCIHILDGNFSGGEKTAWFYVGPKLSSFQKFHCN